MSAAFTPGPWTVDDGDVGLQGVFRKEDGSEIAYLIDPHTERRLQDDVANASLIAAAPELYEALEKLLLKERRRYADNPQAEKFYRKEFATELAVLAKARGEQ